MLGGTTANPLKLEQARTFALALPDSNEEPSEGLEPQVSQEPGQVTKATREIEMKRHWVPLLLLSTAAGAAESDNFKVEGKVSELQAVTEKETAFRVTLEKAPVVLVSRKDKQGHCKLLSVTVR